MKKLAGGLGLFVSLVAAYVAIRTARILTDDRWSI